MTKRFILVDSRDVPDYLKFSGLGISTIYDIKEFEEKGMDENQIRKLISLGHGDAALVGGAAAFKWLREFYHYGVRNEGFVDCKKLYRLSIEGGGFLKIVSDPLTLEEAGDFLSDNFTTVRHYPEFKQKVLKTVQEVIKYLDWIESLPDNVPLGFDYEASGMALDEWFELAGGSIVTEEFGGYISFTDLRRVWTEEEKTLIYNKLSKILVTRQSYIWTFNQQYEFQVSHRMFGIDLYNLCDAKVFNILNGDHMGFYSLKWTAQKCLGVSTWDTDFDKLSDLLDSMYFIEVGKLKRDKKKILKVTPQDYQQTEEWAEICKLYPNHKGEFEVLINDYFGQPYMNIPSDILGYYCNLDSLYTLKIYTEQKNNYTETCIETYLDNLRLGARLHSVGMYKDEIFRLTYKEESLKMMAWGITYCATARCKIKMEKHKSLANDLSLYSKESQKLLEGNKFFNGDTIKIAKYLLEDNIDYLDTNELGIDEGKILMEYGIGFAEDFKDALKKSMIEAKWINKKGEVKQKVDSGVGRKKKILALMSVELKNILSLNGLDLGEGHTELEKYMYYEKAYNELIRISQTQLGDIYNVPSNISGFDFIDLPLQEYSDYISDNYFKCKSPIENDEMALDFANLFKYETAYLGAMLESTQQMDGAEKFYENMGVTEINDGFQHFMAEWKNYCTQIQGAVYSYPEKAYTLATDNWRNPDNEMSKKIWTNMEGFTVQTQFFKNYKNQTDEYEKPFSDADMDDNFYFMRKLVLNYLVYKKYAKVLSTYIDGMYLKSEISIIENPNTGIPIRKALPNEPGAVSKVFIPYQVNTKSTKRWSSAMHTMISKSDLKSVIRAPKGYLLTYFDCETVTSYSNICRSV